MSRTAINRLWADSVDLKPQDVDWSERLGENLDGWNCWEAVDCQECGKVVILEGIIYEEQHRTVDEDGANGCMGHLYSEGPQMNYLYPLPEWRGSEEDSALAIAHLPLCIVELDGEHGLALTGGGMDLSWAICEAYMRLGWLPPVHFCRLPNYAGMTLTSNVRWILAGCQRSCRVMAGWAQSRNVDIRRTRANLRGVEAGSQ